VARGANRLPKTAGVGARTWGRRERDRDRVAITLEVLVERQEGAGVEQRVDAAEFEQLYAATYRSLVSYCRRVVRSQSDAEEIAQEAFLRAWQSWDRYAPSRPFWPWVATIARRICIDRGRHSTMASATIHRRRSEICSDRTGSPEEALERKEEERLALTALESLKPDQRRVISLRDLDGWSYEDIARFEGTTVESIRGSLRRARAHLRESYARLTWSSPAVLVLGGLRRIRRRLEQWATETGQIANASSVAMARAGEAIAAVLAITMSAVSPHTAPQGVVVSSSAPSAAHAGGAAGGAGSPDGVYGSGSSGVGPGGVNGVGGQYGSGPGGYGGSGGSDTPGVDGQPGMPSLLAGGVPGAPSTPAPGSTVNGVPGNGGDKPEQASFLQILASPHTSEDHELYASGQSYGECTDNHCAVLYHSTDAGKTWTRLPAFGFDGGTIMLPPSYPADSRIFVAGPDNLKVSSDHGNNFVLVSAVTGTTAISPAFSSGDPEILIGAAPGWAYHDGNPGSTTPVDFGPLPASSSLTFAFSPAYPSDPRILVGTATPGQGGPPPSAVTLCTGTSCGDPVTLSDSIGVPEVLTSSSFASTGLAFAWVGDALYRTSGSSLSFSALPLPASGMVRVLTEDTRGVLYLGISDTLADGRTSGGLFNSTDHGSTWQRLGAGTILDQGVNALTVLPGGRLLAAPTANAGGALRCSADGGKTWAPRCPS